ncbi:hypothetical protein BGW36DRAFT_398152 [Talaromyces proteolyticus]|uniref:Protection of telomeres protein 1 n=1 Tax=Talaromyces proteolyticus TaxID=1131652 RepID=A0AAD4PZS4_9EURO|nr:uncharacterized protein BGW36DRAFT_398152 [Talaromyces proteolyticus]KAH8696667.1 hypothetical protein BGW36DRAFT_398152 [Talaromyces proteolyticus]
MPPVIPPKFSRVDTARNSQGYHSVIGVVVDCLPKRQSNGTSFTVTFTLKDSDYESGNKHWEGLKVKYFKNDEHLLPDVKVNDVILLRQLRVRLYQGTLLGVVANTDHVAWAIFRQPEGSGSLVMPECSAGSQDLSREETAYANSLLNSATHAQTGATSSQTRKAERRAAAIEVVEKAPSIATNKRDKFCLIKGLTPGDFADLIVHVVKTWYEDDKVNLYVTDYTVNKSLFNYEDKSDDEDEGRTGDKFGYLPNNIRPSQVWRGPTGRMTLQITLWYPHSTFARENVKEDSYVSLNNVHVKSEKQYGRTEGIIHTDRIYPEKLNIHILDNEDDDPRFTELKKRKRDYWRQNKLKRGQIAEDLGKDGCSKKSTKKKKKEQKKEQPIRKEEGQTELDIIRQGNKPNPYIQAKDPAKKSRTVLDILTNSSHKISLPGGIEYRLPFQNVKYRTTIRVVDFFPPNIIDFAAPYNPDSGMLSDGDMDGDELSSSASQVRWEWRFCLLVEDATITPGQPRDQIKLYVSGAEAEFLLKLDAVDLRKNKNTLLRLREKLCILWGDLEERKNISTNDSFHLQQKSASRLPFTCCVKEYGVRCPCQTGDHHLTDSEHRGQCLGWERRFALFGTTIHED